MYIHIKVDLKVPLSRSFLLPKSKYPAVLLENEIILIDTSNISIQFSSLGLKLS